MINNNFLKLFSIIIAIFLWIVVAIGQVETKSMTVPVSLINSPKGYLAVTPMSNISVTIKGSARVLTNLNYSSIILNMDISSLPVGDSVRRILPSDFTTPVGVEIVEVEPSEIPVTIDQIAKKKIRIVPTFIGEVAKGFKVESITTKPNEVTVQGVKSKIQDKSFISTLPINISNLKESTVFNIGFKSDDGVKSISPDSVEIKIKMKSDIITKDIKNLPVVCLDLSKGLSLKGSPLINYVRVTGRADLIDKFSSMSAFVVNCSQIKKPGKYSGVVAYRTTVKDVNVNTISPQKINFEIE